MRILPLVVTFLFAFGAQAAALGEAAPSFRGTDVLSGKTIQLSDLKGKPVVLEWNNFECPFVKKFYGAGEMQRLQKEWTGKDVTWVTINSNAKGKQGHVGAEQAKALLAERKANPSYYLIDAEGTIGRAYGAKTTPHMFVIDAEGKLVYHGAMDNAPSPYPEEIKGAKNYVSAALSELKAGKPVSVKQSQPYGCNVKY